MMDKEQYKDYIDKTSPKTKEWKTLISAFVIGGIICCVGEMFKEIYTRFIPALNSVQVITLVTITMVFLGSFLTAIGVYEKIGRVAGAGSIIPITGFANAIVSPAMEFNREGIFYGVMSKMFVVAGPVIVSAVVWSVIVGAIYYTIGVFV